MKNETIAPHIQTCSRVISLFALPVLLNACGGSGSPEANAPSPTQPPAYQVERTDLIAGTSAFYDFEGTLSDISGNSGDATVVGHTTEFTELGNISYDSVDGIHALSTAAVLDGISGLLLPSNVIFSHNFSVSMWVKPDTGTDIGTLFFAKSNGNALKLDATGLTVSGDTGLGSGGDESLTYTGGSYLLTRGEWQHVAFTVEKGLVDIYLDGERVYRAGDLVAGEHTFADGWQLEHEDFADFFSGTGGTIAIGVTDSVDDIPFKGKIDNVRIFNSALYFGNITTLSQEVENEGPGISYGAEYVEPDVNLTWTVQRFTPEQISITRTTFRAPEETEPEQVVVLPGEDEFLLGSTTTYTDAAVPIGENYQYAITAIDAAGHVFNAEPLDLLRVPGEEPYAAVTAQLNVTTEDIELSFYTENINVGGYDVLRDTDPDIADATVIATGLTEASYIDEKDDAEFPHAPGTPYYYWINVTDTETSEVTTSLTLPNSMAEAAGEYIPPGTFILEENTDGFCTVDGTIDDNNIGETGPSAGAFANTFNVAGSFISWRINVAEAGTYNLYVGYANGAGDNRWGILTANGDTLIDPVNLPPSGAWNNYISNKYVVELPAGDIDLVMTAQTGGGLANIDYLRFEVVTTEDPPTGVPCAP